MISRWRSVLQRSADSVKCRLAAQVNGAVKMPLNNQQFLPLT